MTCVADAHLLTGAEGLADAVQSRRCVLRPKSAGMLMNCSSTGGLPLVRRFVYKVFEPEEEWIALSIPVRHRLGTFSPWELASQLVWVRASKIRKYSAREKEGS